MLQWPYLKVVFAVPDIFEVETTPKVEPGESFNDVWRFHDNFMNPAFKSKWPDDNYWYSVCARTSICWKMP